MAFEKAPVRSRDELVVRGDLADEVRAQLDPLVRQLEMRLRALVPTQYPTPQVIVQSHVDSPVINMPDDPAVEVEVTIPGMAENTQALNAVNTTLGQLLSVLRQPVTKAVQRDGEGLVSKVMETRG